MKMSDWWIGALIVGIGFLAWLLISRWILRKPSGKKKGD
jgi:hypothetical protein